MQNSSEMYFKQKNLKPIKNNLKFFSHSLTHTHIYIYIYIYIIKKKQQTSHIRIINLFPSCLSSLPGKFKCSLLNSFLVLIELLPTPV